MTLHHINKTVRVCKCSNSKTREPRKLKLGISTHGNLTEAFQVYYEYFYFYIPSVYGLQLKKSAIFLWRMQDGGIIGDSTYMVCTAL
jgi:hypothetical protein